MSLHLLRVSWRILVLLPAFGVTIALIGTLMMSSYGFPPLFFITSMLSRIDNLEAAWNTLTEFDDDEVNFSTKSRLARGENGFTELVGVLDEHSKAVQSLEIVEISVYPRMYHGTNDEGIFIGFYMVEATTLQREEPIPIAELENVETWIRAERLDWSLVYGLPVLCLGLLVSLLAHFIPKKEPMPDKLHLYGQREYLIHRGHLLGVILALSIVLLTIWAVNAKAPGTVTQVAVILTLLVLMRYAYDTYRVARWTTMPSASFVLVQGDRKRDPFILTSLPRNYSRIPLVCWCNLHAQLCGKHIDYGGFYSGEKPWYLQPMQQPQGVVDLRRILTIPGYTEEQACTTWEDLPSESRSSVLRLDVEFWYTTLDGRFKSPHFREGYYFDFGKKSLVLDPHLAPTD